uniref:Gamma-secretase subunit PEN-2 n=1 Tax=Panagrolaimus superbus TaxID=310955 RepID=A0A914Z6L8_9BILA
MNLERIRDTEKLDLCRKYFYIGCFCLPFVWLVNFVWFFKHAYKRPHFAQQELIRKYTTFSIIGCIIWTILIVAWNIVFHYYRTSYAQYADYLSFVFPIGYK